MFHKDGIEHFYAQSKILFTQYVSMNILWIKHSPIIDGVLPVYGVPESERSDYLRRESFSGTCARSFYVGDVKKEDIHAKFEDGVLHVELPAPQQTKALPENPNLIAIE